MNLLSSNTTSLFVFLGIVVAIVGISLLVIGATSWLRGGNKITSRLEHYVSDKSQVKNEKLLKRILPRETTGSLLSRTIIPGFQKVTQLIGRLTPEKQREKLEHDLVIAGNPGNLHAREFSGMQFLFFLAGLFLGIIINLKNQPVDFLIIVFGGLIVLIFVMLPRIWLNSRVRSVQDDIRLGLPDALDMLSVCAAAGLGFDQSLQKISSYWQTPLGVELKRVTQEMEMGVPRSQALKNLSERMSVDDLSRFISIIIQAETMGMSYADVLHSQAVQMRILRQYRAREIANKLPAKMIVPLALFIFPALIAVILGPIVPTLLNLF
jgi:tight adherence protein C